MAGYIFYFHMCKVTQEPWRKESLPWVFWLSELSWNSFQNMFPIITKGHLSQLCSQSIIYIHFSGFHQMQSDYVDWTDTAP